MKRAGVRLREVPERFTWPTFRNAHRANLGPRQTDFIRREVVSINSNEDLGLRRRVMGEPFHVGRRKRRQGAETLGVETADR
jgi:hypothetical protein